MRLRSLCSSTPVRAALALSVALAALPQAEAAAPKGRYSIAQDTITDVRTKLVWESAPTSRLLKQVEAQSYCAALALGGFAAGWRVPKIKELASLIDVRESAPAMDHTAFGGAGDGYWSSTVFDSMTSWLVYFSNGHLETKAITALALVRCVHD